MERRLAATEIQKEIADRNAQLPDQRQIEFRTGVNLGDVVIDGDDIQGDGVNVAAGWRELLIPAVSVCREAFMIKCVIV